jgi:transcriptional regulator with XRE-family HTH domain
MNAWGTTDPDDDEALGRVVIGAGVRAGRRALHMTQRQLAWRVHVSQSFISRLETGTLQGARLRTLARIAGVLEAEPPYAFPGGPPPPARRVPGKASGWDTTPARQTLLRRRSSCRS